MKKEIPEQSKTPLGDSTSMTLGELRQQIFRNKADQRSRLARLPILEKLRMMEEMRDFTFALQACRDENKARVKDAWQRGLKLNPTSPLGIKIQAELAKIK